MKFGILASTLALVANAAASKVVVGYFPNWLYANYPVSNITFSKYTHINYAFAILNTATYQPAFTDPQAVSTQVPQLVTAAHAAGVKVLLSIGGWTGCLKFSSMVASAANRQTFVDWNVQFIKQYNTDGVDIDWEYPGAQGAGCNEVDPVNDSSNFATLVTELRAALDSNFPSARKEISLANRVYPFATPSGPSTNVSAFVASVDRFQLMTYDVNGAWANTTGPNSPLNFEAGKGLPASFVQAIHDWNAAGVPYSKIVGGLPFYGRAMQATENMDGSSQYAASQIGAPSGDSDDAYWQDPYCSKDPGGVSGIWKYKNLRSQGLLTTPTTAGNGWQRYWDNTSQTPWLFNPSSKIFISYDDPTSIGIKVNYALCKDIAGVMIWDVHQDNGELLDAVQAINGKAPSSCGVPTAASSVKPSHTKAATSTKPSVTKPAVSSTTRKSTKAKHSTKSSNMTSAAAPMAAIVTPSSDNVPLCSIGDEGLINCQQASGTSPAYYLCANQNWVPMTCPSGQLCFSPGFGSAHCGTS